MFYAAHRMFAAIGGASIALALVLIVFVFSTSELWWQWEQD
jgi:hypothetical protein